ncbi:MAG: hypothetical protein QOE31_324 [Solirubrobacteraceae bacterium]|nr:hypothetical protein [Solirubrobacteraceae bacterium]
MTLLSKATAAIATAATGFAAAAAMTTASAQPAPVTAPGTPKVALVARLAGSVLDASPDPAGKVIYFTTNGDRGPAIRRVPLGGGVQRAVLVGGPLRGPAGIAVSNDAERLFVADRKAGHILVVPVAGGRPHVLRGSAGSAPRGLEMQTRGGRELVVYSGRSGGRPALLRLPSAGAARPTVLLEGAPLRAPDGVAISRSGAIYVTDHGPGGGRALRVDGDSVTTIARGLRLGNPAGIALTLDESSVLISSLNRATNTAQVLIVDTATAATSVFDDVIGTNHSAGGLHRARAAAPMGWADVQRPGRVYRVDP